MGDKNAESKGDMGHSSKRRGSLGAFKDSFNTQLRDEENSRQDMRKRALDDGELHRMQQQQSGNHNSNNYTNSNNSNDRREYRRNDVVAVQYLTVSAAPPPSLLPSRAPFTQL